MIVGIRVALTFLISRELRHKWELRAARRKKVISKGGGARFTEVKSIKYNNHL